MDILKHKEWEMEKSSQILNLQSSGWIELVFLTVIFHSNLD